MARPFGTAPLPSPPVISIVSRGAPGAAVQRLVNANAASGVSPWSDAADTVLAFPFVIEAPTTFYKVFWVNGSAAGGNSDVAIYDENYNLIVGTGAATAGSGNSVPQVVALTATTTLPPGRYYAGMTHSATTTNQIFRFPNASNMALAMWQALGCWKFTDNAPISSATATPADYSNSAFPWFGLITRSVFDV
jgi:hypothetical protein